MKILIVSYHFLPEENPRAFRWSSIVSHWLSIGYDVSVITASTDTNDQKVENFLYVNRVPENLMGRIRSRISRKNTFRSEINASEVLNSSNHVVLLKWIKGFYSLIIKRLQWPDFAWTWIFNARKAALVYLENNLDIDVVISVSHPFSSHIVGSTIKRKYPNIRWIMDIGDPFSFLIQSPPNNFLIYNRLNKFIERKYFFQSDFISVTTYETMSEYLKLFPENKGKIKVIPPVLSTEAHNILKTRADKLESNQKPLKLVYIGTLYSGIRHPEKMLNMLTDVRSSLNSDFEVHFLGPVNGVDISKFTNSFTYFHGSVSHDAALHYMLDADILLNIGNSTMFQLPSKLVEYVCTGKPVLNVISTTDDSSKAFLESYHMSKTINISNQITDDAVREVSDYIQFASIQQLKPNDVYLKKYSVQNISKQYEHMFY
jgi:hypothetical protein